RHLLCRNYRIAFRGCQAWRAHVPRTYPPPLGVARSGDAASDGVGRRCHITRPLGPKDTRAVGVISLRDMQCPRCHHEAPPRAKFCPECATPLPGHCAKCESELPVAAKYCPQCAAPVSGPPDAAPRFASPASYTPTHLAERIRTSKDALEGERKHVTV